MIHTIKQGHNDLSRPCFFMPLYDTLRKWRPKVSKGSEILPPPVAPEHRPPPVAEMGGVEEAGEKEQCKR